MKKILFLLLISGTINAQTGFYLSGDTLRYNDGDGHIVQFNKTGLFTLKTDTRDSLDIIRAALALKLSTTGDGSGLTGLTQSQISGLTAALAAKQAALESGTNIKTINGSSVLGSGDLVVSGSAAFSSITGQPTDNANLSTALDGKVSTTTTVNGQALSGNISVSTYAIPVQALTSSPADGATIYFGNLPKAPTTTANISKIYIRQAGTIKRAEIYCYSGTAGTAEAWVMNIRKNNTTDTQIASVAAATSERVFSNTGLSISVAAGDYIEIKCVNPTWATNPLTTIFGGYIYIEN